MLNIDPHTFGRTKACEIVAEKLNAAGDAGLVSMVSSTLTAYFAGLRDLMRLTHSRTQMMKLYYEHCLPVAESKLKDKLEAANIPFSYINNIMQHKYRQSLEHSAIIERFNIDNHEEDNRDYKAVLDKLVDLERKNDFSWMFKEAT